MAREMRFAIGGREYSALPAKIDRKKLYGWSEVCAFDDDGNECTLVSTDASGTVVIPKGGIRLGMLAKDGKWVERGQLRAVKADGSEAAMNPSSYSGVIALTMKASEEEFLDCSITALYQLRGVDQDLIGAIGDDIYKFEYCYNDSFETMPAFLLVSEDSGEKGLFMFIGSPNAFEFIGLAEAAIDAGDESSDEDEGEGDGDIDFSMF